MKDRNRLAVIVQARLNSQRIPAKMVRPFADTTLLDIALSKLELLTEFEPTQKFASLYDESLIQIAGKYDVTVFQRSKNSAFSEGQVLQELYEWWDQLPFEYAVLINPCVPFLAPETISRFINAYLASSSAGMFGVIRKKNYFWDADGQLLTPWSLEDGAMDTKRVQYTNEAAHCLYAGRLDRIGEGIWMGKLAEPGDIELFPLEEEQTLDIDYPWQFELCETLYSQRQSISC